MLYLAVAAGFLFGYFLQYAPLPAVLAPARLTGLLNRWIINLALPALILATVPQLQFSIHHLFALLVPWVLAGFWFVVLRWLAGHWFMSPDQRLVLFLLLSMGNTAFLGLPLIRAVAGEEALLGAIVYDQLGSFLVLSLLATAMVASHGSRLEKPKLGRRLINVLQFPPFASLLLGLALSLFNAGGASETVFPALLQQLLEALASTVLPLSMIVIGLQFRFRLEPGTGRALVLVLGGKMLLTPALVLFFASLLAIDSAVAVPSVLQSAMPPMVTGVILLVNAGIAPRLASSLLGFATLASALTLPAWFYLTNLYG